MPQPQLSREPQAVLAAGRDGHAEAVLDEEAPHDLSHRRIVVDHQHQARPRGPVRRGGGASAACSATSRGRRMLNVRPCPGALATVTSPPISQLVETSAWENSWKSRPICSSVRPIPVSITSNTMTSPPPDSRRTTRETVPRSVNLRALDSRLNSAVPPSRSEGY